MTLDIRTLVHRGGAGDDLCEKLGIPAQPVIEWHTWGVPVPGDPVPFESAGWRYLPVEPADATDRSAPAFDDTTWATGPGAFGDAAPATTSWPAPATVTDPSQALWLRRTVPATAGLELVLQLRTGASALDVYWNGTELAGPDPATGGALTVPGDQVLASNVLAARVAPAATEAGTGPVVGSAGCGWFTGDARINGGDGGCSATNTLAEWNTTGKHSTTTEWGIELLPTGTPQGGGSHSTQFANQPRAWYGFNFTHQVGAVSTGEIWLWHGVSPRVYVERLGTYHVPAANSTTENPYGTTYALYVDAAITPAPATAGWSPNPDRTAALTHYTTSYGRQNPTGNTEPLQIGTGLVEALAGDQLPTVGERFRLTIAAPVATALGLADDDRPRFTGEVTDVDVDTEGLIALAGVGRAARLGRVAVGGTRWPVESTGNRVARILAAVSTRLPLDLGTLDAGGPQLLARPGDAQPAGQLLEQASTATTGQLVEQRTGQLEWHNETHRRNPTSRLTLAAGELLKPFRWTQRVGTVVNDARVTYGDPQATVAVTDPTSTDPATGLGPYPVAISTELVDQADAYALGSVIVGRRTAPTWELPQVTVDLVRTAGTKAGALLGLRHGHLVTTTGLPAVGPYTVRDVFVEGATETFTRTSWRLSLTVADKALAGVALRWIDIPADETWNTLNPALTWLDLATAAPDDL